MAGVLGAVGRRAHGAPDAAMSLYSRCGSRTQALIWHGRPRSCVLLRSSTFRIWQVRLTQQELVARVERLKRELKGAWEAEERVRALKTAIQVSEHLP